MVECKSLQNMTVGDVRQNFPLPGSYMFRFKTSFKNTFIWKDATRDDASVPCHEGKVVAKVSRLRSSLSSLASPSVPRDSSTGKRAAPRSRTLRQHATRVPAGDRAAPRPQKQRRAKPDSDLGGGNVRGGKGHAENTDSLSGGNGTRSRSSTQGKERRYSDLLNIDDIDEALGRGAPNSGTQEDALTGKQMQAPSTNHSPVPDNDPDNDLMGLGGLDFSVPTDTQQGMRPPASSFGGSAMDALDPMQMRRTGSANSAGSASSTRLNINTAPQSQRHASAGGRARRDSPRSAALKGLMSDLSGLGSL